MLIFTLGLNLTGCDQSSTTSSAAASSAPSESSAASVVKPAASLGTTDEQALALRDRLNAPMASAHGQATATTVAAPATGDSPRAALGAAEAADKGESAAGAKPIQGPAATGEGFKTWLQTAQGAQSGKPGQVELVLEAQGGFKCNAEYPYKFKLEESAGVSFPQMTVSGMRIEKLRSTLAVPFVAEAAGSARIAGTLSFSVCTDDKCLIEKQRLQIDVPVSGS